MKERTDQLARTSRRSIVIKRLSTVLATMVLVLGTAPAASAAAANLSVQARLAGPLCEELQVPCVPEPEDADCQAWIKFYKDRWAASAWESGHFYQKTVAMQATIDRQSELIDRMHHVSIDRRDRVRLLRSMIRTQRAEIDRLRSQLAAAQN